MPQILFALLLCASFINTDVHPIYKAENKAWFRYRVCVDDACFNVPDTVIYFFLPFNTTIDVAALFDRTAYTYSLNNGIKSGDTLWSVTNRSRTFLSVAKDEVEGAQIHVSNQYERYLGEGVITFSGNDSFQIKLVVHGMDSPSVRVGNYNYVEYYKQVPLPNGVKYMNR